MTNWADCLDWSRESITTGHNFQGTSYKGIYLKGNLFFQGTSANGREPFLLVSKFASKPGAFHHDCQLRPVFFAHDSLGPPDLRGCNKLVPRFFLLFFLSFM